MVYLIPARISESRAQVLLRLIIPADGRILFVMCTKLRGRP
jgi:hypothetical protein